MKGIPLLHQRLPCHDRCAIAVAVAHASNVGVKIRHVFNDRKRIREGYRVWTGHTIGCWQWDLILGEYQTLGAAQHMAEAYLTWRALNLWQIGAPRAAYTYHSFCYNAVSSHSAR
jgi:hypothetical protein